MSESDPPTRPNGQRWDQVALRVAFTKGLTPDERAVLSGLAITGHWKTGAARITAPSLEQLADYAELSRRQVARTIEGLRAKGWIKTTHRRRQAAMHSINLSRLETVPGRLAKVPDPVAPDSETSEDKTEECPIGTPNSKECPLGTVNPVSSAYQALQDGFKECLIGTIFTDQCTYGPSTERSDQNKFPDQEPALRATPPPDNSQNDENPEAKANLDTPVVDFAAMRVRLSSQPPSEPSHRKRVVARRAGVHA